MPYTSPSPVVWIGIVALSLLVAALVVVGFVRSAPEDRRGTVAARATAGAGAYFIVSGCLAAAGMLARSGHGPPPFLLMMAGLSAATVFVATGPLGARFASALPLWALVGLQAFRLPLELVLLRAAKDGTMPVQMSFEGRNFDVVTGVTALGLALVLYWRDVSRAWVLGWNVLGAVLLANVVGIAVASLPWIHAFGTDRVNEWVLHFPFVWLPAILVQAALFGHIVVSRRLKRGARIDVVPAERARATSAARGVGV